MRQSKKVMMPAILLLAIILAALPLLVARHTPPAEAQTSARAGTPKIDKKASEKFKQMSDYLGSLEKFWFHAEIAREVIYPDDQRLDLQMASDIYVQRPNKIRADITRMNRNRQIYYDGNSVTVYSPGPKLYATAVMPATIDEFLNTARDKYGIIMPLSSLLRSNIYSRVMPMVTSGKYVGMSIVNGVYSHQLAFRGTNLDFQLWVQDGDKPLPRKLAIVDKALDGHPQYVALLTKWNVDPTFDENLFTFTPPEGAQKIRFLDVKRKPGQR